MLVSHILAVKGREVATVAPEAVLAEAARALTRRRIGALIVCAADGSIAGIVSERDIVGAVAVDGAAALDRPVRGYMTQHIATCAECDTVEEIMETMTNGRFRHVPVMRDGALCGIVSIGDIVKSRIEDAVHEAQALKDYIRA